MSDQDSTEFVDAARRWLAAHSFPARDRSARSMALVDEVDEGCEATTVARARAWQRSLYDAGYAALDTTRQQAFAAVASEYELPDMRPLLVGLHIVAPALARHGSPTLTEKYLHGILRGDQIACQLFSEPDAGSDLAAVRTKAVPVDGGWLVTGQKIWTSNAHIADVAELLVRTDSDAPKHGGLSLMMVDMDQSSVDVRPLRQMTGGASFNEVFLHDVFVPSENLIGDMNGGWSAAMTSLSSERAALGGEFDSVPPHMMARIKQLADSYGRRDDPVAQVAVADLEISLFATDAVRRRAGRELSTALAGSVTKLMVNRTLEHATQAALELGDRAVVQRSGQAPDSDWSEFVLGKPAFRLAGGTDEIQRNLIAERHLGLPKEART